MRRAWMCWWWWWWWCHDCKHPASSWTTTQHFEGTLFVPAGTVSGSMHSLQSENGFSANNSATGSASLAKKFRHHALEARRLLNLHGIMGVRQTVSNLWMDKRFQSLSFLRFTWISFMTWSMFRGSPTSQNGCCSCEYIWMIWPRGVARVVCDKWTFWLQPYRQSNDYMAPIDLLSMEKGVVKASMRLWYFMQVLLQQFQKLYLNIKLLWYIMFVFFEIDPVWFYAQSCRVMPFWSILFPAARCCFRPTWSQRGPRERLRNSTIRGSTPSPRSNGFSRGVCWEVLWKRSLDSKCRTKLGHSDLKPFESSKHFWELEVRFLFSAICFESPCWRFPALTLFSGDNVLWQFKILDFLQSMLRSISSGVHARYLLISSFVRAQGQWSQKFLDDILSH